MWGAHYLHDGAQPEGSGRRTRWGNCWVVVVLVVELPCLGGRQVGLPVLFRLFRPKDDDHPDRRSQPELAQDAGRHGDRALPGPDGRAGDGRRLRQQGVARAARPRQRHHADARQRAACTSSRLPAQPGQKGRPPLKGAKLPTLAEIAKTAVFEPVTITGPDGRSRTAHVHELICLWYKPFYTRPVKVMLIRNPGTSEGL